MLVDSERLRGKRPRTWVLRRIERDSGKPKVEETPIGVLEENEYSKFILAYVEQIENTVREAIPSETEPGSEHALRREEWEKSADILRGKIPRLVEFTKASDKSVVSVRIYGSNDLQDALREAANR